MSERHMRSRVLKWLRPLNGVPVENPAQPGTPDINYVEGWLELKQLHSWPRDPLGIVRVPHFTPQQRNWLKLRRLKGGRAFLLLQVKEEWLLLDGEVASTELGRTSKGGLLLCSIKYWQKGPRAEELRAILAA